MTKEKLFEILQTLNSLPSLHEERLSDEAYEIYKAQLKQNYYGSEAETVSNIIMQLDLTMPVTARSLLYPSSYDSDVGAWISKQLYFNNKNKECYFCAACQKEHVYDSFDCTVDHDPPLSVRFNREEYTYTYEERKKSYNDTTRMRLMCRSQNSSLGGIRYDRDKVLYAIARG